MVGVLGQRNSGKSYTWNMLFGHTVRTGSEIRKLYLTETQYVQVFLVSGSAEEREIYVGDIIKGKPAIVLCSIQFRNDSTRTFDWFSENNYFLFVHWLNPGWSDSSRYQDEHNISQIILDRNSLLGIRSGKTRPEERVQEMRDFIYGWAQSRNLLLSE